MRHRQKGRKLGRTKSHRELMLRNLVTSLFDNESIRTTEAKAKEARRLAERMVSFAKRGDLHARRQVLKQISNQDVVKKLFDSIAPRFEGRNGGYTRIIKLARRHGDAAPVAILELTEKSKEAEEKEVKKVTRAARKAAGAEEEETE
ncbi:MAG: 50S ribosomal protein L17 [bacterium]|jgi:large subunit ribosomal protein L17